MHTTNTLGRVVLLTCCVEFNWNICWDSVGATPIRKVSLDTWPAGFWSIPRVHAGSVGDSPVGRKREQLPKSKGTQDPQAGISSDRRAKYGCGACPLCHVPHSSGGEISLQRSPAPQHARRTSASPLRRILGRTQESALRPALTSGQSLEQWWGFFFWPARDEHYIARDEH